MSVITKVKVAVFEGTCGPEDAETLLQWLLDKPNAQLNLKCCEHLHAALLQVIMECRAHISVWPQDPKLYQLLLSAGLQSD